jgi:hypothetical protein
MGEVSYVILIGSPKSTPSRAASGEYWEVAQFRISTVESTTAIGATTRIEIDKLAENR